MQVELCVTGSVVDREVITINDGSDMIRFYHSRLNRPMSASAEMGMYAN